MKKLKIPNNPLFLSLPGNVLMIAARTLYVGNSFYTFLLWNLLLAGIPLLISTHLYKNQDTPRLLLYGSLFAWLLFLPNAPYIITDLVHLYERPPVPYWFDMLLVLLSVLNGLAMGFLSIAQVEKIIHRRRASRFIMPFRFLVMLAMSYGVYLGRYLRFNSWDILFNPQVVINGIMESLNKHTLAFVLCFSFVSFVLYSFYRAIPPRHARVTS